MQAKLAHAQATPAEPVGEEPDEIDELFLGP